MAFTWKRENNLKGDFWISYPCSIPSIVVKNQSICFFHKSLEKNKRNKFQSAPDHFPFYWVIVPEWPQAMDLVDCLDLGGRIKSYFSSVFLFFYSPPIGLIRLHWQGSSVIPSSANLLFLLRVPNIWSFVFAQFPLETVTNNPWSLEKTLHIQNTELSNQRSAWIS